MQWLALLLTFVLSKERRNVPAEGGLWSAVTCHRFPPRELVPAEPRAKTWEGIEVRTAMTSYIQNENGDKSPWTKAVTSHRTPKQRDLSITFAALDNCPMTTCPRPATCVSNQHCCGNSIAPSCSCGWFRPNAPRCPPRPPTTHP